ncbi:MAG: fluoride efflux transporter CrcB [Alphaproteobacteria bacterium]|nr:MAG: fluoride efflux transporter CrcB [Alphaproteobacteria bacterium]
MPQSLTILLMTALGGAVGASLRHLSSGLMMRLFGTAFPWGTLFVNVLGSFLMGVLIEVAALKLNLSQEMRAFLAVGILGGFTTFSTFALDAVTLFERGAAVDSFAYVLLSVVLSIAALFAGLALMRGVLS